MPPLPHLPPINILPLLPRQRWQEMSAIGGAAAPNDPNLTLQPECTAAPLCMGNTWPQFSTVALRLFYSDVHNTAPASHLAGRGSLFSSIQLLQGGTSTAHKQRGHLNICCYFDWIDKYWFFVNSTNITTNIETAVLSNSTLRILRITFELNCPVSRASTLPLLGQHSFFVTQWTSTTGLWATRPLSHRPLGHKAHEPQALEPLWLKGLWLKGFVAQGPVAQGPVAQGPVAQGPVAQVPVAQRPLA